MQVEIKKQSFSVTSFYDSAESSYVKEKEIIVIEARNVSSFENYSKEEPFNQLRNIINNKISNAEGLKLIFNSGLCGCGGSHIPLFKKWQAAVPYKPEFLVVNGLEGEPYTYKDYFIMLHYPQLLIEGITISCRLLEINEVYLLVNSAYKLAYENLTKVVSENTSLLKDINIHVMYGPNPDLYIVGEETALLNYIEGKRAEPRLKPPYPHEKGLWNKSTIINNVETLSWIPLLLKSPERFKNKHPKLVTLSGDVKLPGIYEVDMGDSLEKIIDKAEAEDLSFIEVGGISGGLIPKKLININYDVSGLSKLGLHVGSGTIRLFNNTRDPLLEMSKSTEFFKEESCGRCTPCRVGTQELLKFSQQLLNSNETDESINWLHSVSETMQQTSTCGLGKAASVPVVTYLKHFRNL
ncbi:MAG: hypothetical protein OQK98_09885 [Gammaproteobacteria bacterium]|nr:hypothetical protein [Gammaproteobacteria bacterium]